MCEREMFECRKNELFQLIREALWASSHAHELVFKEPHQRENEFIAGLYLAQASSRISAARSLYWSNYEILNRSEVESIFNSFGVFECELLQCIKDNHSHQWTDIEFRKFKETVEAFVY